MPAAQRWNTIYGTFRSGQLSPASQDDVGNEVWQNGAAEITNFRIERDGGLSPRPALRRSDIEVLVPTRGLLAGARIRIREGGVLTSLALSPPFAASQEEERRGEVADDLYTLESVYGPPYGKEGGAVWLGGPETTRILETGNAPPNTSLLRIEFPEPVDPSDAVNPGAITFHGVRLTAGDRTHIEENITRLNLAVWLGTGNPDQNTGRWAAPDTAGAADEDPFTPGAFAPGILRRDLVIPCDIGERVPLTYIELRARSQSTSAQVSVGIDGVSCFGKEGGTELPEGVLDRPWRLLPWPVRSIPYVLTLGMDHMQWVQLSPDERRGPQRRVSGESVWHFTARQLRELTWSTYGGNLALWHQDFPHGLEVKLPLGRTPRLRVLPLPLVNVPFVTDDASERVLPEISGIGTEVELAPIGTTDEEAVPFAPQVFREIVPTSSGVAARWPDTGAEYYLLDWEAV